jgi:hypothetical protein
VFNIVAVHVEFMADKLAPEQIFLRILANDQGELENFLGKTAFRLIHFYSLQGFQDGVRAS